MKKLSVKDYIQAIAIGFGIVGGLFAFIVFLAAAFGAYKIF